MKVESVGAQLTRRGTSKQPLYSRYLRNDHPIRIETEIPQARAD